MTFISKISLFQFRNYEQSAFSFHEKVSCITGLNGAGKTSLLDGVYTLCYTKSYFSASVLPTIKTGTDGFRVEGTFAGGENRKDETVSCIFRNGKKELLCNGSEYEKLSDHIGKYAAVMIAPDDIELVNGGSELRRKFIDGMLSQSNRDYLNALMGYQKALQQRNALLKNGAAEADILRYLNSVLADAGQFLFDCRTRQTDAFVPLLRRYYTLLSGSEEQIEMQYRSELQTAPLHLLLEESLQDDLRYRRTMKGVHRDDLVFKLNGTDLKSYGSQGQKKSFLFALKLAQYVFLTEQMSLNPILLLDDIFEKLDRKRMIALLDIIYHEPFGQVMLTDTDEQRLRDAFGARGQIGYIRLS